MKYKGYSLDGAFKEILALSDMDNHDLMKWKNQKKWEVFNYHLKNNSMYKKFINKRLFKNWCDIPVITKNKFQSKLSNNISKGFNESDLYIANTTGSSGHPFIFAKDKYAHSISWAGVKFHYKNNGIDYLSEQARFLGIPIDLKSSMREKFKDYVMNRKRFDVYSLGDDNFFDILNNFRKKKFFYIYGYANTILSFARFLLKENIILKKICPTLSACISTSEMLFFSDRDLISKAFGVKVINEYGSSETSLIGIENINKNLIVSDNLLVEVLDDNNRPLYDSSTGRIVITDLYNLAMPFIRYEIGDIGNLSFSMKEDRYKIEKLQGRESDMIYLPSGKISPGLTFYYISKSLLENSRLSIEQFLIRQTKLDEFYFEIKSDRKLDQNQMLMVKKEVTKYLEPNLKVIFSYPEKIENISNGKIKHFFSELHKI